MTISGGSALSKDDIDRMVREAEQYAEEDAKRREAVETRNQADQLVYTTEVPRRQRREAARDVKTEVQADVDALKATLGDAEASAETLRPASPSSVSPARRWAPRCTPPPRPTRPPPVTRTARPARPTTTSSTPRSSTRARPTVRRARRSDRVVPGRTVVDPAAPRRPGDRGRTSCSPRPGAQVGLGFGVGLGPGSGRGRARRCRSPRRRGPARRGLAAGEEMEDDLAVAQRAVSELPTTSSACRPSSSTTSDGSSGTASWCGRTRRTPRSRRSSRSSTPSTGPARHGEVDGGFRRSPTSSSAPWAAQARQVRPARGRVRPVPRALSHIGGTPRSP